MTYACDYPRDAYFCEKLKLDVRTVKEFPIYLISNCGRIFTKRFSGGKYPCWYTKERKRHERSGYFYVNLYDFQGAGSRQYSRKISRLVATYFISSPPSNTHQVDHIDCNPKNDHISNLRWVTPKENMAHVKEVGHMPMAENHKKSKLTNIQVSAIKRLSDLGANQSDLAILAGVNQVQISRIIRVKTWKSVII